MNEVFICGSELFGIDDRPDRSNMVNMIKGRIRETEWQKR